MIGDKYLANIVAEYLKVCVDLFLVLSGYGLNASMNKNKYSITKFYKKHIWKIYKNYWLIWILFVPIGVMSIPLSEVHAIRYRSPHNPLKKSIFFKS